ITTAQMMVDQGQQELVEGRRVAPRRGPSQDGGGRGPFSEEGMGHAKSRPAVPVGVDLDPLKARLEGRERPVRDPQAEPAQRGFRGSLVPTDQLHAQPDAWTRPDRPRGLEDGLMRSPHQRPDGPEAVRVRVDGPADVREGGPPYRMIGA